MPYSREQNLVIRSSGIGLVVIPLTIRVGDQILGGGRQLTTLVSGTTNDPWMAHSIVWSHASERVPVETSFHEVNETLVITAIQSHGPVF